MDAHGLKTGSTSGALYNLSASASRDGFNLIAVVMKAPTSAIRFKNASSLLDYGFTNFEYKTFAIAGDSVTSAHVEKGITASVNAIVESNCGTILSKGNDINIEQSIEINPGLSAPIKQNDVIGKVVFSFNGEVLSESNLIAEKSINKINIFTMNEKVIGKWYNLLR